ncbi:MAG TPA: hypothetical protein VGB59_11540 [Allosphingosinicella sp.]|jgi:hypothetical protein
MSLRLALAVGLIPVLSACAAQVSHPTKSLAEQQVDINYCTEWANNKYWMDPVAALLNAYDCLEAKGYKKGRKGLEERVKQSAGEDRVRRAGPDPTKPCTVPCKR